MGGTFFMIFQRWVQKIRNLAPLKNFYFIRKFFFLISEPPFVPPPKSIKKFFFIPYKIFQEREIQFYPFFRAQNGVPPVAPPRGFGGQKFFAHKLGLGNPSKWATSQADPEFSFCRHCFTESRSIC